MEFAKELGSAATRLDEDADRPTKARLAATFVDIPKRAENENPPTFTAFPRQQSASVLMRPACAFAEVALAKRTRRICVRKFVLANAGCVTVPLAERLQPT